MTFKPKLVVFDLDGTLAESKQRVSAEMGELFSQLLQRIPVAVMSGASLKQFETQLLPSLPSDARLERLYLFPTNAASCYLYRQDKWHPEYDMQFSADETEKILKALDEALGEVGLREEPPQLWGNRIENRSSGQISFSPLGQQAPVAEKEKWNREHNDIRKRLRDAVARRLPGFNVAMGGLTTIDITHADVSKAFGIKKLVDLSRIAVSEMLYVGDAFGEGGNDAVVVKSGIKTHPVLGPEETAALIKDILDDPVLA